MPLSNSTLKAPGTKHLKLKYDIHCFQLFLTSSTCAAADGKITVSEVRAAFPRGLTFPECVAKLLAKDGTLTLPMSPAVFLGRGAQLDAATEVGPARYCSPRHWMPFHPINEVLKCVSMT